MANKNTQNLNRLKRLARRNGLRTMKLSVPVYNYHSATTMMTEKNFEVAGGSGVVSRNEKRNMQMRVLNNAGGGENSSLTVHERIRQGEPATPKPKREKKD